MGKFINIAELKKIYEKGENIVAYLKAQLGAGENTVEMVEIAYDLQAGTKIAEYERIIEFAQSYAAEQYGYFRRYAPGARSIVDVGCGELTALSYLLNQFDGARKVFAFDVSWSRVFKGLAFARRLLSEEQIGGLRVFCADINRIPLPSNSVDVVTSSHALEPNHGRESELLAELIRIARQRIILFEPCYELASQEAKARMEQHGYVRDLAKVARELGATVVEQKLAAVCSNSLNPTGVLVLEVSEGEAVAEPTLVDPLSHAELAEKSGCLYSPSRGVSYPVIEGIPMLRSDSAILTTGMEG